MAQNIMIKTNFFKTLPLCNMLDSMFLTKINAGHTKHLVGKALSTFEKSS